MEYFLHGVVTKKLDVRDLPVVPPKEYMDATMHCRQAAETEEDYYQRIGEWLVVMEGDLDREQCVIVSGVNCVSEYFLFLVLMYVGRDLFLFVVVRIIPFSNSSWPYCVCTLQRRVPGYHASPTVCDWQVVSFCSHERRTACTRLCVP
jgi:hypothetical protein